MTTPLLSATLGIAMLSACSGPSPDDAEGSDLATAPLTYDAPKGWRPMQDASTVGLAPRREGTAVWTGLEMIVWGGRTTSGNTLADGGRYDPVADRWALIPDAPISPRRRHAAVWNGTRMYVWGGRNGTYAHLRSGASFHPSTNSWYVLPLAPHTLDEYQTQAVWASTTRELIVWGSQLDTATNRYFVSGMAYATAAHTWRQIAKAPFEVRKYPAFGWAGGRMVVWGGEAKLEGASGRSLSDGAAYDPITDTWNWLPPSPMAARREPSTVIDGTRVFVWGGTRTELEGGEEDAFSDGAIFDVATWTWTAIPANGAWDAKRAWVSSWFGAGRLYLWGGTLCDPTSPLLGTMLSTGYVYDPAARTWTPLPAPSSTMTPRGHATGLWTGSDAIAWSGRLETPLLPLFTDGWIHRP